MESSGSNFLTVRVQYLDDTDPFSSISYPEPTRPPNYTLNLDLPLCEQISGVHRLLKAPHKISNCALQLSNSQVYLDLDSSVNEQRDDFDTLLKDKKRNSIILRTQLSVRVHACIQKLYNCKGRELRRALFALKQIFQDDKDLVHQFVNADGLTCLIKVGAEADQNYQNYILRALSQIMIYVDGMEGVISHCETVRWLYSLTSSKFRLVVKTSMKLLIVFVEYTEKNALLLLNAVQFVDAKLGQPAWNNLMTVLGEKDGIDTELLTFAMTLINKTLSNVPDQDTFYDITDSLEKQNIDEISQRHLTKKGNDIDLVKQFKIYEMALKHEDGEEALSTNDSNIRWNRSRIKSTQVEERKSHRRKSSFLMSPHLKEQHHAESLKNDIVGNNKLDESKNKSEHSRVDLSKEIKPWLHHSRRLRRTSYETQSLCMEANTNKNNNLSVEVDPCSNRVSINPTHYKNATSTSIDDNIKIQRRMSRIEQRRLRREQEKEVESKSINSGQMNKSFLHGDPSVTEIEKNLQNKKDESNPLPPSRSSTSVVLQRRREEKRRLQQQAEQKLVLENNEKNQQGIPTEPVIIKSPREARRLRRRFSQEIISQSTLASKSFPKNLIQPIIEDSKNRELSSNEADKNAKICPDLTENPEFKEPTSSLPKKLQGNKTPDVLDEDKKLKLDMLYSTPSNIDKTSNGLDSPKVPEDSHKTIETKLNEKLNELSLKDIKFNESEDKTNLKLHAGSSVDPEHVTITHQPVKIPQPKKHSDEMWEKLTAQFDSQKLVIDGFDFSDVSCLDDIDILSPPKLPTTSFGFPPPPPVPAAIPLPPSIPGIPPPPPVLSKIPPPPPPAAPSPRKSAKFEKKRTVRLFWKEASTITGLTGSVKNVWNEIEEVNVDNDKYISLFTLKNKESTSNKKHASDKKQEVRVLDVKRSNAINIGLTVLPPPRTIKSAIIAMDEKALTKEQVEKLLVMVPTEDEINLIQDAMQSSTAPLGSAEKFLLTLSSISELEARLSLWSFKVDYDTLEKEVAEPLQDLKDAIAELKSNKTLKVVLSVLRSIGNILNNTNAKGFDVSYLSKVPEVKDTMTKQSLLHHITECVLENRTDTTDLYSELGAVTRTSRADFGVVEETLKSLEKRCKSAWDYLKLIAKHGNKNNFNERISEFLIKSAHRIITLKIIHKRLINRFNSTLIYFGLSAKAAKDTKIQAFARMISEFALEYRTARDRLQTKKKKKHDKGARKKTRGKTIIEGPILFSDKEYSDEEEYFATPMFSCPEEKTSLENVILTDKVQVIKEKRSRNRQPRAKSERIERHQFYEDTVETETTDPMMEQIVKTATRAPTARKNPVERRKRSRNLQRKSLRRTLKNGLSEEEQRAIGIIK